MERCDTALDGHAPDPGLRAVGRGGARSRVVVVDARNYWRFTKDRYDVIVADLFVPWCAETGALYSREQFQAMRDRLEPGGLVAQWLPIRQLSADELRAIAATFTDVFPTVAMFRGDFFGRFPIVALVGWRDRPLPATDVAAAVRRLAGSGVRDRWITKPVAFWSGPAGPSGERGVPRNLLDRPYIEYQAAARHVGGERGKLDALGGLEWIAEADAWRAAAPEPDPLYPDLPYVARRARDGGAALQRAGAPWADGLPEQAARALEIAAEAAPVSVVREAPPDRSAADVWPERGAAGPDLPGSLETVAAATGPIAPGLRACEFFPAMR
jgi:spermidine synthase